MAHRPPLPNPDSSHLVGTIEAMLAAMQQQNANMVNQHNLALQSMEFVRLAVEATQHRHLKPCINWGRIVLQLDLPKLHHYEYKNGVWRIFFNIIHPASMARPPRMRRISG